MTLLRANRRLFLCAAGLVLSTQVFAQPLIISEFRVRGPNGANDEFIEIYNASGADHTVSAASGTGYGVAASDGVTRCSIPNGTVIPNFGHYLCVNSVGYSLASYPAGNGTTATGDATYTTDIPDNAGIALFNNNTGGGSYTLANRMDAVGSTSEANTLYKEGTGYGALTPFSINYSFMRDQCGKGGSITTFGPCPLAGSLADTGNNAADFVFVDTNGTSAGAGQRLGAPGPENLSGPLKNGGTTAAVLDSCVAGEPPNQVRDFTSDPSNNSTFGTLDLRYTFTNNTGGNLTRLRFRIVDLTTFPAPPGIADLRPRTSSSVTVTVDRPPCGSGTSNVTVQGTTLEQPPSQPNGSGFNGSLSVNSITLGTPLANGASVDVRFLLGIQQTGAFRFGIVWEGLPGGGSGNDMILVECTSTDGTCVAPSSANLSIIKTDSPDPVVVGQPLTYSLVVSNAGPGDATDVVVTDPLPAGLTFQSAMTTQGSCGFAAPNLTCNLGTLANGGNDATVTVVAIPQSPGMVSNTATVDSQADDPDPSNNSSTVQTVVDPGLADLEITKSSSANPATVGIPFAYTLNVVNHGPQGATSVAVADTLPANLTFGSAMSSVGSCLENAGTVTCQLGTLASQASATIVIEVTPTVAGALSNTATVTSDVPDPNPANNSGSVAVEVGLGNATFAVSKDFTDGNPAAVPVTISCNTGLPLQQSKSISEAGGVTFVVTQFQPGDLDCTISEAVPAGYLAEYFDGSASSASGCSFQDVGGNAALSCQITNTPAAVDIEIEKLWVVDGSASAVDTNYELTLTCNAQIVGDDTFSDDVSRVFTTQVIPGYPSSLCSVAEEVNSSAVEVDNGCQQIVISAGHPASCVVTNTVFFESIPALDPRGIAVLTLLLLGVGLLGVRRLAG